MHTLLINLPFMIFATALILGILSAGMYYEYRKSEKITSAVKNHPSSVTKTSSENETKDHVNV